jgi:hypothetical protein
MELLSLMDEFISDVEQGRHKGKWCSTFYSSSKVGEIAMAMIYAREMAKTGERYIEKEKDKINYKLQKYKGSSISTVASSKSATQVLSGYNIIINFMHIIHTMNMQVKRMC